MLLESLTKHPCLSTADHISKTISCGRCGMVNYHLKSIRLKTFGGWKVDWVTTQLHARILRGKGVQKKKPDKFTDGNSTSPTFCPTSVYIRAQTHIHIHTQYTHLYIMHMQAHMCIYIFI